jgi:hypothetical protein
MMSCCSLLHAPGPHALVTAHLQSHFAPVCVYDEQGYPRTGAVHNGFLRDQKTVLSSGDHQKVCKICFSSVSRVNSCVMSSSRYTDQGIFSTHVYLSPVATPVDPSALLSHSPVIQHVVGAAPPSGTVSTFLGSGLGGLLRTSGIPLMGVKVNSM